MQNMSVWYQLDLIAGPDLRKRIDGIHDIQNWLKDFAKKGGSGLSDIAGLDPLSFDDTTGYGGSETCMRSASSLGRDDQKDDGNPKDDKDKKQKKKKKKKKPVKKTKKDKSGLGKPETDLPIDYGNVIDCSFNLPRISARLERLMGTNVVRLTDRKYMNDLRERIQDDYMKTLQKRIEVREEQEEDRRVRMILNRNYSTNNCPPDIVLAHSIALAKEMERERNLIMTGKGGKIPSELANHPVFIVNQKTNDVVTKRRAKLKTTREKNAERLLRQSAKWERERLIHDEMERQKEREREEFLLNQRNLEETFKAEDSERGLDLLRIHDQSWDLCEVDLRDFMENQRASMEKRLELQGQQYSNDPKEISNIVQARRKFRETEQRIRQELEEQIQPSLTNYSIKDFLAKSAAGSIASRRQAEQDFLRAVKAVQAGELTCDTQSETSDKEKEVKIVFTAADDQESEGGEQTPPESVSLTDTEHEKALQVDMQKEVQQGHLLSKAEYDLLHYEDPTVMKLKHANNVSELYVLAEEIINGEPVVAS